MSSSEAARIVGVRVRDERLRLNVSQMELAISIGMNVAHLGRIERGETNPTLEMLVRIAGEFGWDTAELVRGITRGDVPAKARPFTIRDFVKERDARAG